MSINVTEEEQHQAPTQQPEPTTTTKPPRRKVSWKWMRSPWVLIPLLTGLVVIGINLAFRIPVSTFTNLLNTPYTLLAIPTFFASIGVLIAIWRFFQSIIAMVKATWQAFQVWRKQPGAIYWMITLAFMSVSIIDSGSFFNELLKDKSLLGILGFLIAGAIDLVAIICMRARIAALRKYDYLGVWLNSFGVIICAVLSAFANVYTTLGHYTPPGGTQIPWWILDFAPWFGLFFPLLLIFLAFAGNHTAEQTSNKLDPQEIQTQANLRLDVLRIKKTTMEQEVALKKEIRALKQSEPRHLFWQKWQIKQAIAKMEEETKKQLEDARKKVEDAQRKTQSAFTQAEKARQQDIQAWNKAFETQQLAFTQALQELRASREQDKQETQHLIAQYQQAASQAQEQALAAQQQANDLQENLVGYTQEIAHMQEQHTRELEHMESARQALAKEVQALRAQPPVQERAKVGETPSGKHKAITPAQTTIPQIEGTGKVWEASDTLTIHLTPEKKADGCHLPIAIFSPKARYYRVSGKTWMHRKRASGEWGVSEASLNTFLQAHPEHHLVSQERGHQGSTAPYSYICVEAEALVAPAQAVGM